MLINTLISLDHRMIGIIASSIIAFVAIIAILIKYIINKKK